LRIGVLRDQKEKFQAHAWVESSGIVVIGGLELERYEPLTSKEEKER
jgi:hypothetical protein